MDQKTGVNAGAVVGIDEAPANDIQAMVAAAVQKALADSPQVQELKDKLAKAEAENTTLKAAKEATQMADLHNKPGIGNESHASTKARYGITLDSARDKNEIDPVFLGCNGRAYLLKRGKYLEVPPEVIGILNHAVQTITVTTFNERTGVADGATSHNARRFPYRMHGKAVNEKGERLLPEGGPQEEQLL
jgi:hypothetical protein